MKELEQLMAGKKSGDKMSEQEIQAKMDVVQELLHMAQAAMGSKVKGGMDEMQKVSVAAPDKESLLMGLDKAKDLADKDPMEAMEDPAEEAKETPEEEKSEMESGEEKPEEMMMMPEVKEDEEEMSPFMKKASMEKSMPKKKKLFSMMDDEE
jgi:hypothetical protein